MTTKPKEILEGLSRLADLRPDLSFEDDALKQVTIGVQNLQNAAPETTYEEQIAQFFAGMLQSRVTDPSAYNRYIVTAIVRNMQMGMSQQYATTMNNAITTALNDEYGQISSTIGTNLPIDMATIQQSMGLKTHGDEWLTRVWEPDDIAEEIRKRYSARLMAVLSDHDLTDEERAALEAYGSGEGHGRLVGKSAAMTLLMPSDNPTTAYQRFQEGLKMMPVGQEAIDFLAKKYKERDKDPHYWAMRTGMGVENLANAQLLDPYSSLRANLEKAIENISMAGRSKKLGMELTKMFQTWNQEQLDSNQVLDTMQNKAEWTLEQLKYDIDYAKTRGGGRDQSGRPVSEYDSNRVLQLEVFLDLLKDIRKGINGVEKNTGKKPAKLNDPAPAFIPLDTQ